MTDTPLPASEHAEQVTLMEWVSIRALRCTELDLLFAIPNGGARDYRIARKLKAEGVKAGVPDLCLPVARGDYHGLYIELKRAGGRLSAEQHWWRNRLIAQGYRAVVCEGWEAACDALCDYLGIRP